MSSYPSETPSIIQLDCPFLQNSRNHGNFATEEISYNLLISDFYFMEVTKKHTAKGNEPQETKTLGLAFYTLELWKKAFKSIVCETDSLIPRTENKRAQYHYADEVL